MTRLIDAQMKYLRRFLCWIFGHPGLDVWLTDGNKVVVYCHRCELIMAGGGWSRQKLESEAAQQ